MKYYITIAQLGDLLSITVDLESQMGMENTLDEFTVEDEGIIEALRVGLHSQLALCGVLYENTVETRGTFASAKYKYGIKG